MGWEGYFWSALAAARITAVLLIRRRRVLFLGLLVLGFALDAIMLEPQGALPLLPQ